MLELQQNLAKVRSTTEGLRRSLVEEVTREYLTAIDVLGAPSRSDVDAARDRARLTLRQRLLSSKAVALIDGGTALAEEDLAQLAIAFESIVKPLWIPEPTTSTEAKPVTLALAGAGGALGGMLLGASLWRLAFDMRDTGLAVGGPVGAFLAVVLVYGLARTRIVAKVLPWLFVRPKALRGTARTAHEKAVRAAVEQWVNWAVSLLAILCMHRTGSGTARREADTALPRVAKLIYTLHQTRRDGLAVVAHELIQEAKNSGFEGLEGEPAFLTGDRDAPATMTWEPGLANQYETFGAIGEGDRVTVERPAVVFDGRVLRRGLVRRVRDRA
jgi:hypothetical protein